MNSVLKYPGAKHRAAKWLVSLVPEHEVYCEPYFGSGAVFFAKPKAKIETINDLDGNVVNYFRVVREHPEELSRLLSLTPYAREEYMAAFEEKEGDTDIEKARKFAVRCFMGFSCSGRYRNGFRSSQRGNGPRNPDIWRGLPDAVREASLRLTDAQIECLPALELIRRYGTKDVFLYVDPPYLGDTRKKYLYRHEMDSEEEHKELLGLLLAHPGKVMVSGYDNPLYNEMLAGWRKEQRKSQAENGLARVETVWMNYGSVQMRLPV